MGSTRITWTPISHGSGTRTLNLGTHPILFKWQGFIEGDVARERSKGGIEVTRAFDCWHEFKVEQEQVGPENDAEMFNLLTAWSSHALRGGEFTFALDSDDVTDTLMNGAHATAVTSLTLDTTTGMEAGDWLYIEAEDSPFVYERNKVDTIDTGTTLTLLYGLRYDYPDNSIVRHADYLPVCKMIPQQKPPFFEREAGRGIAWDLEFTLRTVR
jgi:hypothetical protein